MHFKATSFATYQDLRHYVTCLLRGGSETHCYNEGDNGVGAWGDITAQEHTPMVALGPAFCREHFGSFDNAKGKKVYVTLSVGNQKPFVAIIGDKGPNGVVDLNPASLLAAGLEADAELNCDAKVELFNEETK